MQKKANLKRTRAPKHGEPVTVVTNPKRRRVAKKAKPAAVGARAKRGGAKSKSARGAMNIKVNVVSKNPKPRRKVNSKPRRKAGVTGKKYPRAGLTSKHANRFEIIANKHSGDRLYYTGVGGEFAEGKYRACLYKSFRDASKKAKTLMAAGLVPAVKSLQVKRA